MTTVTTLKFNGINQFGRLSHTQVGDYGILLKNNFAVECKFDMPPLGSNLYVFCVGNNHWSYSYGFRVNTNGSISVGMGANAGSMAFTPAGVKPGQTLKIRKEVYNWVQKIYCNDVLVDERTLATNSDFFIGVIGSYYNGTSSFFKTEIYYLSVEKDYQPFAYWDPEASKHQSQYLYDTVGGYHFTLPVGIWPTDLSQWITKEIEPAIPGLSRIGFGWAAAVRDFGFLTDWMAAKKTSPIFEKALCRGDLTNGHTFFQANDFIEGALVEGDIPYKGNNHLELARNLIKTELLGTRSNVTIKNLYIKHGGSQHGIVLAYNNKVEDCYVEHTGGGGSNIYFQHAGYARRVVLAGTVGSQPVGSAVYFGRNTDMQNVVAIRRGIGLDNNSGSTGIARKLFSTANYIQDLRLSNGAVVHESATGDNSGASWGHLTGYDTSHFVDYDNADYRIKLSSPLHALGIGAYFEPLPEYATPLVLKAFVSGEFIPASVKVRQSGVWVPAVARI